MAYAKGFLCIACASFLTACNSADTTSTRYTEDLAVMAAKDQGVAVLLTRVRENLRVQNNVIVVDGPLVIGAVTLSKNSTWAVSCGEGLVVDFSKGQINLVFPMVTIDDSRCAFLTRRVGEEVQRIIDGQPRAKA
jgi:hypothetical protein